MLQHPVDVATPYHAFSYTNTSICWGSRLPYRENISSMNWLTPRDPMGRLAPRHHPHHNNHRFLSSLGPTTRRYTVEKQLRKILYTGVHLGVCTRPVQTRMAIRTKKTLHGSGLMHSCASLMPARAIVRLPPRQSLQCSARLQSQSQSPPRPESC